MPDSAPPTVSGLPADKLMAAALSSTPVSSPAFAWVPPAVEEVAPWFPDYEIQSLAGRGAMGAVYHAVQRKLERPVAIKLLPAELAARDGVEARFVREARALALLNHPGIVALHDFGRTDGGHLFIVMEYVDGTDLSRLIHAEGGGLGVEHALEIVGQVCDALQYAHSRGFVHRDIKPGNVLVDKDGRVKIADFGLAKVTGESGAVRWTADAAGPAAPHSPLTLTGQALGTPDYTAPEQLKGGPVDHRADIYSLGVMFYEMLTGELPRGAWPPPSTCTAAPARLDEVVTRAMQTEPANRYQQASEVKAAVVAPQQPASRTKVETWYRGASGASYSSLNRVMVWLMLLCVIACAFITPTGDAISMLFLAAPFLVLTLYFKLRRGPAGFISVLIAGVAAGGLGAAGLFTLAQLDSKAFRRFEARREEKEAALRALLVDYGENHPKVQKARAELNALRGGVPADLPDRTADAGLAEARAAALTEAMQAWVSTNSSQLAAVPKWPKTDEDRYALIKDYLAYAPATLTEYAPNGFSFRLPESPIGGESVLVGKLDAPAVFAPSQRAQDEYASLVRNKELDALRASAKRRGKERSTAARITVDRLFPAMQSYRSAVGDEAAAAAWAAATSDEDKYQLIRVHVKDAPQTLAELPPKGLSVSLSSLIPPRIKLRASGAMLELDAFVKPDCVEIDGQTLTDSELETLPIRQTEGAYAVSIHGLPGVTAARLKFVRYTLEKSGLLIVSVRASDKLDDIDRQVKEQEARVEAAKQTLTEMVDQYQIIDSGMPKPKPLKPGEANKTNARADPGDYLRLKQAYEFELEALRKMQESRSNAARTDDHQ